MKWNEEQTVNFIMEYIKYECLYNKNSPENRDRYLRKAALLKISNTLKINGFGPKEVYQKIRSLKSMYSQELKKVRTTQRSGDGTGRVYTPHVKWFYILHDALSAVNSTDECIEAPSKFETISLPEFEQEENDLENDNDSMSNEESFTEATSQKSNNDTPIVNKSTNINVKPLKRIFKEYDTLMTRVHNVPNAVNKGSEQTEHEFDIFGKSIAAQLKNMPLDMAIEAQMFIQNYLSETRLRTLQRTVYTSQHSSSSHSKLNMQSPSP